jgi:hypothetical protein
MVSLGRRLIASVRHADWVAFEHLGAEGFAVLPAVASLSRVTDLSVMALAQAPPENLCPAFGTRAWRSVHFGIHIQL